MDDVGKCQTLGAARQRRGSPKGIRTSVTDLGIQRLAEGIEFLCRQTQCRTFQVEPVFAHGRALTSGTHLGDYDAFVNAFLDAYDIAQFYGRHLYYSGARPWVTTDRFCVALDEALIVSTDGRLTACYEVFGMSHPFRATSLGRLDSDGHPMVDEAVRAPLG